MSDIPEWLKHPLQIDCDKYKSQRDELLEALKIAEKYINNGEPLPENLNDPYYKVSEAVENAIARAAIEKV